MGAARALQDAITGAGTPYLSLGPWEARITGAEQESWAALAHWHVLLCLLLAPVGAFLLTGLTHPDLRGWLGSECGAGAAHHPYTKWGHMSGRHRSGCIACLVPIWLGKSFQILVLIEIHLITQLIILIGNILGRTPLPQTERLRGKPGSRGRGGYLRQPLLQVAQEAGDFLKKFTISAEPCWGTQFPSSGDMMPAGLPFGLPFVWPKPPVRVGRMAQELPPPRRGEVFLVRNAQTPLL